MNASNRTNPPLAGTLTQRLLRLWPYFRSAKTGIALAAISTLIGALTEPLIPALLKTLLDRGFAEGNIELWMVPVALMGLFGIRGIATFIAQYALSYTASLGMLTLFTLGLCWPMAWDTAGSLTAVAISAAVLLISARQTHPALSAEFDASTAWVSTTVHVLAVLMFVAIALVSQGWTPDAWHAVMNPDVMRFWVVFTSVGLSIAGSFVLGYVVVMRLVRRLEYLSQHDALTGLLNRRAIETLMDKEAQHLHRFGDPFALVLIDVDHFKRVNDRLGHAAGDLVLSAVASVLQSQAREVDHVARFGGEEFLLVLTDTGHDGALRVLSELRAIFGNLTLPHLPAGVAIGFSTGIAEAHAAGASL